MTIVLDCLMQDNFGERQHEPWSYCHFPPECAQRQAANCDQ